MTDARHIAAAAIAIAGITYLVFRTSSANAEQPGPGALLYPADNSHVPHVLSPHDVLDLVNASNPGLDPLDVLTFVKIESSFSPTAYRYEAGINDASIGLMQVLSSTARQMGFSGDVSQLYDPATNLQVGMNYLVWLRTFLTGRLGRDPTNDEWVASYNEGPGNVIAGVSDPLYVLRWNNARATIASLVS